MQENKISAGTQYGDLKGNVSIDGNMGNDALFSFAKENGINTDEYFPISIGVYKEGKYESISIDTSTIASSYDEIKKYLRENPDQPLPVKRFNLDVNLEDYLNFIKRFSFVVTFNDELMGQAIIQT